MSEQLEILRQIREDIAGIKRDLKGIKNQVDQIAADKRRELADSAASLNFDEKIRIIQKAREHVRATGDRKHLRNVMKQLNKPISNLILR